jgi:hypothetical protein
MFIGPTQTFIVFLLVGGAYGAYRGWRRESITTAVVLSNVLFLSTGGAAFLAHIIGSTIGATGGTTTSLGGPLFALGGGGGGSGTVPPSTGAAGYGTAAGAVCDAGLETAISRITFVVVTWLGYRSGSRYGPPPKLTSHRIAGILPGAVNGAAIAYYVSRYMLPNSTVVVNTPGSGDTAALLPIVFGVCLAALLVVLFVAGQMKKAASAGGGAGGGH